MSPLASLAVALRIALVALTPIVVVGAPAVVHADAKSEARDHYKAGVRFYSQGDYKAAIREFSSAQQKYPADLNNYNLALCYDKLGDAEPAIQYYRAFLDKQPTTDKRAEIEASISRLEAAQARINAKKEAEARKAEAARKAAEEKRLAEEQAAAERAAAEQKRLEEQRLADEEKRRREDAKRRPADPPVGTGPAPGGGTAVGSTGTPSSGATVSTGDAQLDRVASIDINAIREQRGGSTSASPFGSEPNVGGSPDPSTATGGQSAAIPGGTDQPAPKATPVYTKWWFWVIVGVGAYVLYQVASEPDESTTSRGLNLLTPVPSGGPAQPAGGLTLMRW